MKSGPGRRNTASGYGPSASRTRRASGAVRLPRARRWSIYAVAGGVWLTGVAWLAWRYLLRTAGPFGPQASPLEAWWLKAHGLFAFASLWMLGLLWAAHVVNGWTSGRRRWTGSMLFGVALFLAATGYLLYYVGSEDLRPVVSYAHWIVGSVALASFLVHAFQQSRRQS